MNLHKRIEALEVATRLDVCPSCASDHENTITITYEDNDPGPYSPPGEALAPHVVEQCQGCGTITRVFESQDTT